MATALSIKINECRCQYRRFSAPGPSLLKATRLLAHRSVLRSCAHTLPLDQIAITSSSIWRLVLPAHSTRRTEALANILVNLFAIVRNRMKFWARGRWFLALASEYNRSEHTFWARHADFSRVGNGHRQGNVVLRSIERNSGWPKRR